MAGGYAVLAQVRIRQDRPFYGDHSHTDIYNPPQAVFGIYLDVLAGGGRNFTQVESQKLLWCWKLMVGRDFAWGSVGICVTLI